MMNKWWLVPCLFVGVLLGSLLGWHFTTTAWIEEAEFHEAGVRVWYTDGKGEPFRVFTWRKRHGR